jgi:hypothetical protein
MARNIEAAHVASEDEWISKFGCANPDCGFLRRCCWTSISDSHCCIRCCELDTHWRSDVLHAAARAATERHKTHAARTQHHAAASSDQDARSTKKHGKKCEGHSAHYCYSLMIRKHAFIASLQQAATTAPETPMWRPK